jgi:uncharacterized phage-associated protein
MLNVLDVAEALLRRSGAMTAMKLEKLTYYAQAWSLAWNRGELFSEDFQAWIDGPVCPELYRSHRNKFWVHTVGGDPSRLDRSAREVVAIIADHYGRMTPEQLSDLTHTEMPWLEARRGIPLESRSSTIISKETMRNFYSDQAARAKALSSFS